MPAKDIERPKRESKPRLGTRRINEMGFAYQISGTIWAAIELELFTRISEGARTAEAIARACGLDLDAADRLLTACLSLDLIEFEDGSYRNAPDVERYLIKGSPRYHGDWVLNHRSGWDAWHNLVEALRPGDYRRRFDDPARARAFTEVGYHSSIRSAQKLAEDFDFSPYKRLLDLGGGSGVYSIMACQAVPHLHSTILDHPNVCAVADGFIALAGLQKRIKTVPGNYLTDDYPPGADIILFCGTLETHSTDEHRLAFGKAFAVLPPGGALLLVINMLDADRHGPLEAVLSNLGQVAVRGVRGRIHTPDELQQLAAGAGFVQAESADFVPGTYRRMVARKPG
jgi:hypothetical protein